MNVFDYNGKEILINDEVDFFIDSDKYTGIVNFISYNGLIRINALIGEYRRWPHQVIKLR